MNRILNIKEAVAESIKLRKRKKKIVLVGGCFDIFHPGHLALLREAKKQGDILFVLLESDEKISQLKGIARPVYSQNQRAEILSSIRFVDFVVMLPTFSKDAQYDTLIENIQPTAIATTQNDPSSDHKKRQAARSGAKLLFVTQFIPHTSTTKVIKELSKEL